MRRRALIAKIAGAAVWSAGAQAQQKVPRVIGYLGGGLPGPNALFTAAFRQGLRESGFIEGQNLTIEQRWAEGYFDRLPGLAADLVSRKVEVIACGGTQATRAAKDASRAIPIVFMLGDNPVADGLVASIARPDGNVTGVSILAVDLNPKRLELLKELLPRARVIALLVDPRNANNQRVMREMQEAAQAKGVQLRVLKASSESEIDAALDSLAQRQIEALFVDTDGYFNSRREQIVALAARHAVPAIYAYRDQAAAGGLISYGPSLTEANRQVGMYSGMILKGAKPADLPVVQPTSFELIVNLKTAKTLGLTIPPSVLARADEVIE
jgi:putative tryptophan/tyrosine transport system substrate-binding protein